jgi:hypothetical protein
MKKEELWTIYVKKNPPFAGKGNITLSTKGLRKLFDTTWDIAYHEGEEEIEYSPIGDEEALNKLKSIFGI